MPPCSRAQNPPPGVGDQRQSRESGAGLYDWLAERGAAVLRTYSTAHTMTLLQRARVHVVISDLARQDRQVFNKTAGIDLARAIRDGDSDVPIMLHTLDKV